MRARESRPGRASLAALMTAIACFSGVACGGADPGDAIPTPAPAASEEPTPSSPAAPASPAPAASGPAAPAVPAAPVPPAALVCLAQLYAGTPVADAASPPGWVLRFPDATEVPWDDGKTKTYDEKLATPDLQDTLAMPYVLGAITPS